MYVTVVSEFAHKIIKCIVFDAQGFSPDFIRDKKSKIADARKKIKNISLYMDIVHKLLNPIGEQEFRKTQKQKKFFNHHLPQNLLTDDGKNLRETVPEEDPFVVQVGEKSKSLLILPEPIKSFTINAIMAYFMEDPVNYFLYKYTGRTLPEIKQSLEYKIDPKYFWTDFNEFVTWKTMKYMGKPVGEFNSVRGPREPISSYMNSGSYLEHNGLEIRDDIGSLQQELDKGSDVINQLFDNVNRRITGMKKYLERNGINSERNDVNDSQQRKPKSKVGLIR
jgi:hypothetical protein